MVERRRNERRRFQDLFDDLSEMWHENDTEWRQYDEQQKKTWTKKMSEF